MSDEILQEEFEVLESIYPSELSKLSDRHIEIEVEPEDLDEGSETLKLTLSVQYTPNYPDELPDLTLVADDGEINDAERDALLEDLRLVGQENIGTAMTFTLVSCLGEKLAMLVRSREQRRQAEEREKERLALEEEDARTRGTVVTAQSFQAWKIKFDAEHALIRAKEDEDYLKSLTAKEREEWKRIGTRLTGRQLFERNKILEEDSLLEEGTVSVDVSQYERVQREDEDENDHVTFSDSD